MKTIKFSIIMPAYNAEEYIREAIDSVLNQTYHNWELVIVNDGSTDNTAEIIEEYAEKDRRIIAIHQENSGTASAARNRALEIASGDYSQMLDADDFISPNMLKVYAKMIETDSYDIILPIAEHFKEDGTIIWKKGAPNEDYTMKLTGEEAFILSLDWRIHGIFAIRMELLKRIKYDPKLINGDEFTTRKLLYNAHNIGFCKEKYYYRNNVQSTTKSIKNEVRMYEALLTNYNIYEFSVRQNMSKQAQKKSARKLTSSIVHQTRKYIERKELYDFSDNNKVKQICEVVYKKTGLREWIYAKPVYLFLVLITGKSFTGFVVTMTLLNKLKKIENRLNNKL